jgi:hypothetical protein
MKSCPDEFGIAWAAPAPTTAPVIADPRDRHAAAAITTILSRFIPPAPLIGDVTVLCADGRGAYMGQIPHI